jgi:hypothetical protein
MADGSNISLVSEAQAPSPTASNMAFPTVASAVSHTLLHHHDKTADDTTPITAFFD